MATSNVNSLKIRITECEHELPSEINETKNHMFSIFCVDGDDQKLIIIITSWHRCRCCRFCRRHRHRRRASDFICYLFIFVLLSQKAKRFVTFFVKYFLYLAVAVVDMVSHSNTTLFTCTIFKLKWISLYWIRFSYFFSLISLFMEFMVFPSSRIASLLLLWRVAMDLHTNIRT